LVSCAINILNAKKNLSFSVLMNSEMDSDCIACVSLAWLSALASGASPMKAKKRLVSVSCDRGALPPGLLAAELQKRGLYIIKK
jgi:hypothetical protein